MEHEKKIDEGNRTLFGNSVFYAIADLLSKGLHFILLPIYTVFLTTDDYGIQNIVTSFNAVMSYIVLLCLDSATLKYYAEYKDDKDAVKRFYGTAMSIVCIFSFIVVGCCLLFKNILIKMVFKGISFYPYILLGLAILVFDAFYTLHRRMLEAQQQGKKVALIGLISVFISSGLTLLMIGIIRIGAAGVLTATLLTSIGTVVFCLYDIVKHQMLTPCLDVKLAKKMLSYSFPLIPHQVSGYLAVLISKVFLNISGNLSTVGLYGIATQFSLIIDTFQDSVSRAYRPWLFVRLNDRKKLCKSEITVISKVLISLYSFIVIGIALFAQEIILIMTTEKYYEAWKVIPVLAIAVSLKSIYYFYFAQCLYYPDTSRKIFIASITANLCNIISAAFLVPLYGMYGSAIASVISISVNTLIIIFINRRNGDIGYQLPTLVARLVLAWIFVFIGVFPGYAVEHGEFSVLNFIYKMVVFGLYVVIVWFMNKKLIYEITGTDKLKGLIINIRRRNHE